LNSGEKPTKEMLKKVREAAKRQINYEDIPPLTDAEIAKFAALARERDAEQKKPVVTLRLSTDTLKTYKALGKGWTGIMARFLETAAKDPELLKKCL
jgi:uncharacterized protein (DUF4415 family)